MNIPNLDPDLLRAFVAVADHRSFTRAAVHAEPDPIGREHADQAPGGSPRRRAVQPDQGECRFERRGRRSCSAMQGGSSRSTKRPSAGSRERKVEGVVRLGVMDDYGVLHRSALAGKLPRRLSAHPCRDGDRPHLFDAGTARREPTISSSRCIRKDAARANSCAANKPSGRPAPSHAVEQQEPLPVALYPQGCLFRKWAIEALDAARRPWRLAFVSHSLAAVEVDRGAGLAVTVVKTGTFPPKTAPARRIMTACRDCRPPTSACTAPQPVAGRRASRRSSATGISNRRDEVSLRRTTDSVVRSRLNRG